MYTYTWPPTRLGQPAPQQEQSTVKWISDVESFAKVVADHYVRTQYPDLFGPVKEIWCSGDKKMCQVNYSTRIKVLVSFVALPNHVIARRGEDPTGPRCEYDFDCRSSAERVLKKRSCRPD
jgi:hypothetical protein